MTQSVKVPLVVDPDSLTLREMDASEQIPHGQLDYLSHVAVFAKDATTTAGLTWGYIGGRWGGFAVAAGTLALTASSTLYITASRATGAISVSSDDVNWQNTGGHARVYKVVTGAATVTVIEDHRAGLGGVHGITTTASSGGGVAPVVPDATTSRAVSLADVGSYLRFTAPGAKACTFDVATGFTTSQEVHIANRSASGNVAISATGITLNPPKGGTLTLEPGDTVTVKFVSNLSADVFGSTEPAP